MDVTTAADAPPQTEEAQSAATAPGWVRLARPALDDSLDHNAMFAEVAEAAVGATRFDIILALVTVGQDRRATELIHLGETAALEAQVGRLAAELHRAERRAERAEAEAARLRARASHGA